MNDPRKILILDIETSPHLCYSFELRKATIHPIQILEPTRVICFAAKWLGEKKVFFYSEYHHGHKQMMEAAFRLMDEADVVVTYNGDRFDIPHLQREFKEWGLGRPAPFASVDLYKVIRRIESWASHKLGYITESLGLSGKLPNGGMALWVACLDDSEANEDNRRKAWNLMRRYNKQDIHTTEELLLSYFGDVTNMPSLRLYTEPELEPICSAPACPNCGSENTHRRGYRRTKTRRYRRYQCQDCGRWFNETKSERTVDAS